MIQRVINKLKSISNNSAKKKELKMLFAKSVFAGDANKFHDTVLFDTSAGGIITIGHNNEILNGCLLMTYGGSICIGSNCSINPYTILYGHGKGLVIGNNVLIAGHCLIIPSNHVTGRTDIPINQQGEQSQGIIIEDDVWIGAGCQILDGVTIARGGIIAAGSVVNKSTLPYSISGGVPAKLLKTRTG